MLYSLNEIEAVSKKATFGAGLPWGIAEESGKAARWLASHDLPGPELLSKLLTLHQDNAYQNLAPLFNTGIYYSESNTLCPLMAGAALTDRMSEIAEHKFEFGSIAYPLLLVPYVACCAKNTGSHIEIFWDDLIATASPDGSLTINRNALALMAASSASAICHVANTRESLPPRRTSSREVNAENWRMLVDFSKRIYAPATEASRKLGAG